jgi:hypothetical protein
MPQGNHSEGLKAARLLMVLSSISPLFILWAIRGNRLIPDPYLLSFCAVMVVVPNAFLWLRIGTSKRLQERREITVGSAEDLSLAKTLAGRRISNLLLCPSTILV